MAREARKLSKSGNYYILLRGNELFRTKEDKQIFTEILEKNFATGVIHGCEIAKEEIRLVVKEGERGISMTVKSVVTSYARYFNRTYNREGKLFLGRFKSEPLETADEIEEYLKDIKQPVKKKTVKKATVKPPVKPKKEPVKQSLPSWLL